MKNNDKGFTLIQFLIMVAILSFIIIIALPSVSNAISNNKKKALIKDAKELVSLAQYEIGKNPDPTTAYQVFTLEELDKSKTLLKGPNDQKYDRTNSKVIVTFANLDNIKYTVYLYEQGYSCIVGKTDGELSSGSFDNLISNDNMCKIG